MTIFVQELAIGTKGGLRVAVKDTIDIAGLPTMCGTAARSDAPPAKEHAQVVDLVLAAGGDIVGKTVLHELAFGITGINDWSGTPINPHYPHLIPGGSSSGSAAAVAAGLADIALGTDTGGSIRTPAACCGIWGLKPTFGRISRVGVAPENTSLDCVGPFAASGENLIRAMRMIDPTFRSKTVADARIGVVRVDAAPHVLDTLSAALERSGWPMTPIDLPGMDAAFEAGLAVINAETWAAAKDAYATGCVGADVAARLANAANTTTDDLDRGEAVRLAFTAEVDAALEQVDVLALPTLADRPLTLEEGRANRSAVSLSRMVRPFNLSGHPALTLPVGQAGGGPVSLQLVARKGADADLCAIAVAFAERIGQN